MTSASPRLDLPLLQPSQAQKHVTHNEALLRLDGAVQMVLQSLSQSAPPEAPAIGACYFTADAATGDWSPYPRMVAAYTASGWIYLQPAEGWLAWDASGGRCVVYQEDEWTDLPQQLQNLPYLGIGSSADDTNRLTVSSDASLFNHAGGGHQIKVNKSATGQTASLLFQSNWSGRAEMGLCGDDALHLKVSDGGTWHDAVVIDPSTGHISGEAIQSSSTDVTSGRLMRADYGYCRGNAVGAVSMADGLPSGALIQRIEGTNSVALRFADGSQICSGHVTVSGAAAAYGAVFESDGVAFPFPAAFTEAPTISMSAQGVGGIWAANASAATATQADVMAMSAVSTAENIQINVIAVGRWI
ncbi:DUF2793 domain-containing protein [Donghicola mangrovi]|uniref:DUF2793 domain-containing protein n=1 Tax=Donghicola mangrovi TaxID=2729614 RepID=A0A850Q5Z6_9RHOB|nr:DUF2793 domain-containing protein [Donghicola mangrovi]NVO22478.1 DUF2793 domain-containing protein [Donghicola mangrovi]